MNLEQIKALIVRGGWISKYKGRAVSYGSAMGAAIAVGASGQAMAADECGVEIVGADTIICTTASAGAPFGAGITYTNSDGLTLVINDGAITTPGVSASSSAAGTGDITVIGTNFGTITAVVPSSGGLFAEITNTTSAATATARLTNGTINATGNIISGVRARTIGLGNVLAQTDGGVTTTAGTNANGVTAEIDNATSTATATARLTGGSISTTGTSSDGVLALTNGVGSAFVVMTGGGITTVTGGGINALVDNTLSTGIASAQMTAGSISVVGNLNHTILSRNNGLGEAIAQMDGGTINTGAGTGVAGIFSQQANALSTAAGTARMTAGTITSSGFRSRGLQSRTFGDSETLAEMTGGSITASGDSAFGLFSQSQSVTSAKTSTARMTDGSITLTGDDTRGVFARTDGIGLVTATVEGNSTVTASGLNADGVVTIISQAASNYAIEVNGTASVTSGTGDGAGLRTTSLAGSSGTIDVGAGATVNGSAGSTGVRGAGGAIIDDAGDTTVNIAGTVSGDIELGDGSDTLNIASGVNITGVTLLDGGDDTAVADTFIDSLTLTNQSLNVPGTFLLAWENLTVDGGSLAITDGALDVGVDTGTGLTLTNGGVFNAGGAFTLTGNLTTTAGGIFSGTGDGAGVYAIIGSVINNGVITTRDGTAGDTITINGSYTGNGTVNIDTVLGDSGSTTDTLVINGDSSGTMVINVSNAGGAGAVTGTGATDGIQIVQVTGNAGATLNLGGGANAGAYTYNLSQNGFLQSSIAGRVFGYSALPIVLRDEIETLRQRQGSGCELLNFDGTKSTTGSGLCFRSTYSKTNAEARTTIGAGSEETNLHYSRTSVQMGYDQELIAGSSGFLKAGIFGHFKHVNFDVDNASNNSAASGHAKGFGGGASLTWNSTEGFYGDIVGQFVSYDVEVNDVTGGFGAFDALTYSLSAEGGYRIKLNDTLRIVPQMQIIHSSLSIDDFVDNADASVQWKEKGVTTGRSGVALEAGKTTVQGGLELTGYAATSLLRDFNVGGSVITSGINAKSEISRTWFDVRAGANLTSADGSYSFFAEAGASSTLESQNFNSLSAVVGFKIGL